MLASCGMSMIWTDPSRSVQIRPGKFLLPAGRQGTNQLRIVVAFSPAAIPLVQLILETGDGSDFPQMWGLYSPKSML